MRKYHQSLGLQTALFFMLSQTVLAGVIYVWYSYASVNLGVSDFLILVVAPFVIMEFALGVLIGALASRPIKKIEAAIAYAYRNSKESRETIATIDNLLAAIRRLDAMRSASETPVTEHAFAQSLLDHLPVGIAAFNQKRELVYTNGAVPMHGGGKEINLDFKDNDSFNTWLDTVVEKNISAFHWWKRLPQSLVENEDQRHYYDCLAIYRQNGEAGIETVLVIVDRSDQYTTDEDELDFMALASHELRGPITVIRGYVDVLRTELGSSLTSDQLAFFERLDVSADRLNTYISNILNVSRYDRRHLQLILKEETIEKIYSAVSDDLELRARTQHRLLNVNFPKNLPTVAADRSSLTEVIVNLIDNAIKYSSEGGLIVVSAAAKGNSVEFTVQDNGIGIPSSLIGHIFDKFYRSHRSRENTVGTGLGLYIAKAIIESHGGTIQAKSVESHGSTFTFTLPTYASVADKLLASNNCNVTLIKPKEYIKTHSMYRG